MEHLDPGFAAAYRELANVPERSGHLTPRQRALVSLAIDANVTHLDAAGMRRHIRGALDNGATEREVLEVLECCATVSVHAMNFGVPVLFDVLEDRGLIDQSSALSERQCGLRGEFVEKRGYWNATWDKILQLDPDMFAAYIQYSAHPSADRALVALEREFIYIAFDTSATHLYGVGLKLHLENALDLGATTGQLLEIMEIATLIGAKSVTVGAPLLLAETRSPGSADPECGEGDLP